MRHLGDACRDEEEIWEKADKYYEENIIGRSTRTHLIQEYLHSELLHPSSSNASERTTNQ